MFLVKASRRAPLGLPSQGRPVRIARLQASVNNDLVGLTLDDSLQTRWDTGPQQPDQWLELELEGLARPSAIVLALGQFRRDFPRFLVVESSLDGREWTAVWQGPTTALALEAALA